jgi:hypothetical protein
LLQIIWLCTGRPPGEFIETANAFAVDTEIFDNLFATLYVLK